MQLHYDTAHAPAAFHAQSSRKALKGQYMVILKPGVDMATFALHRQTVAAAQSTADAHLADAEERGIRHVYDLEGQLQGYAGKFSDDVLSYIRAHPEVEYVEQDSEVTTMEMPDDGNNVWDVGYDVKIEDAFSALGAPQLSKQSLEKGAPWGLVRVSHRDAVSFKNFGQYLYQGQGGEGVTAYIIDTGINIDHVEFEGRATWGKTMPVNDEDKDGNGHGTHCAGTIGSRKYGVAKKAELVAVKVLSSSGSGSMSDVTGGVLWAVEDAKKKTKAMAASPNSEKAKKHRGFVANMSLGGGKSPTLDRAVNGAVASGMHFGVAAGNENQDACNVSPAGASNPVTVGAMTLADVGASFSNWGKCVDVFAPGLNILSTWNSGNTSTNTISGTSMASPHVVGMLAYLLSIYGSEEFDIVETSLSGGLPFSSEAQSLDMTDFTDSVASKLHSIMPFSSLAFDFVSGLFGGAKKSSSAQVAMAPVPKKPDVASVLHPADLKKAMIKLSTSGKLNDIGQDSPNYLIFNNATLTK
ncbi:putative PRB1-protease B, vacuolar [Acaromyces ingoldii]|uniref:Putative PRB1-protease B, vacuolar n=1 Tax=Acaromyces ingoldii TaxID=215250 RepID=A0A316YF93_9BASI|nr:putative PRB1-protease B, vacuolar [Acaromyces ingoldii]PWN87872.1 putative PRB1-protease B, vacuolar [Acaromyces ingoldii]